MIYVLGQRKSGALISIEWQVTPELAGLVGPFRSELWGGRLEFHISVAGYNGFRPRSRDTISVLVKLDYLENWSLKIMKNTK